MPNEPSTPEFETDKPLLEKSEDRLNRADFASHIANVLVGLPKETSLVVGIHGPWGDGKTTILNLLSAELRDESEVAVVNFNPWRFTSEHLMLGEFFRSLADAVRAKLKTKGEEIAGWLEKLGQYTSVIDNRLGSAAEMAGKKADTSLEDLRERLSVALREADKRIVVLVDDIDRLDKHETRTLFRIIKACADFPNVCYVLAFDDVVVAKSIGEQYGSGDETSGRAFLEKIIQVPLKMPIAMREDLRSLCFEQVDRVIASAGIELSEQEVGEFVSSFDQGFSARLNTPRAAKRFGNALMFALPMLKGEANTVDILLLEAVRAFYPEIYDCIRVNFTDFSGVKPEYGHDAENEGGAAVKLKPFLDNMDSKEQESVKSLLRGLFPRLGSSYGGMNYGSDWLNKWAKEKRVCSPDYCSRYFTYAVPRNDVSDSDVDDLCNKAAIGIGTDQTLKTFFVEGKARRLIERLRQRQEDIAVEASPNLALSLAMNARHIPNPPSLFSETEPPSQAAILISHLIQLLPEGEERVGLAKQVMQASDPLWFAHECLRWVYVTDEADKAEANALTADQVDDVRLSLVERIKERSGGGEPLFDVKIPQEQYLLREWRRVEGREPVQAHLSAVFERDPNSIAAFLQTMAPTAWSGDRVGPRVGDLDGGQLKNIKRLYDLDELAALIQEHLPGDFDDPPWFPDNEKPVDQRLAEQFIHVWKKWKTEGEPADE